MYTHIIGNQLLVYKLNGIRLLVERRRERKWFAIGSCVQSVKYEQRKEREEEVEESQGILI